MEAMELVVRVVLVGVGATLLMDLWGLILRRGFGVATLDYAMLGRWVGHLPKGRFVHEAIGRSTPVRGERALGWTAHYLIGVSFSALLITLVGAGWLDRPTLGPAVALGAVTVLAPFLILQPGLGLGVAASRTPAPWKARARSLATHAVFGVGLYVTAWGLKP